MGSSTAKREGGKGLMATPKPPVQPMSDGLHAVMSKAFFRVKAHSKKFGVAKTGFSKNRVFRYPIFDPKKSLLSHFSGQKVTFGVTFRVTLGGTLKVTF